MDMQPMQPLCVSPFAQAARLQPYLASLAVRPEMRRNGIGQQLVEFSCEEACAAASVEQGCDDQKGYVMLNVEASNVPAQQLYARCGFRRVTPQGCEIHMMQRPYLNK